MKKIALIYNSLGHPELPYETTLRNGLLCKRQNLLHFVIFSCNHADRDVLPESKLLYSSTRTNTIKRWLLFTFLHPFSWIRFLKRNLGSQRVSLIINKWAKFAPLIVVNPDIVHIMTAATYQKIKEVIDSTKIVVSFRGADIVLLPMYKPDWVSLLHNDLFRNVKCAHFVSKYLMEESLIWGGRNENSKVIRIGVDPYVFQPNPEYKKLDDTIVLSTIGRLTWQKGFIYALQAIRILKDNGYPIILNIIGQGESSSEIYFWRRLLKLENEVNIVGFLEKSEKIDLLNRTDIYLQPSITEGLCVTVMEAMAMELPVIASNVGGMPETVCDMENGLLVPPADPYSLSTTIELLIKNPDFRTRLGKAGRKSILDKFSLEREIEEWQNLYVSL